MKHLRWLPLVVLVLAIATGSAQLWANAHRGYPNAVYYRQGNVTWYTDGSPEGTARIEYWDDPQRGLEMVRTRHGGIQDHTSVTDSRTGVIVQWGQDVPAWRVHLHGQEVQALRQSLDKLAQDGVRGQGMLYLAHAVGPVEHTHLLGRPVLRIDNGLPLPSSVFLQYLWLDASSLQLLQSQSDFRGGLVATERFSRRAQRLPPGTLPVDFFEPPRSHISLWDQALEWIDKNLRGHK